jgi:hypothetical protein
MFIFFFLLGLIHPIGTAFDLIYFLTKAIKKSLDIGFKIKRYVILNFLI